MEIIANIGFNWYSANPKDRAEKLIKSASENGAHAVVVPYFKADEIYRDGDMQKRTKQFEMPIEWMFDFKKLATKLGLGFIVSPRHPGCISYFEQIGVQRYHVQNGDIRHFPLLEELRNTDKPLLISTGYATFEEIHDAVNFVSVAPLREIEHDDIVLLHSTGGLPTMPGDALLGRILDLGQEFFPIYIGLESFYSETILDIISMTYRPVVIMRRYDLDDEEGIEAHYSIKPEQLSNLARIAGVMQVVNEPKYVVDKFTAADFDARTTLMRCEHSDYLLPPEH